MAEQNAEKVRVPHDAVVFAAHALGETNWRAHGTMTVARVVLAALIRAGYRIERPAQTDGSGCA